jgi:predicted DNA-binding transcriptional regulator AlpA
MIDGGGCELHRRHTEKTMPAKNTLQKEKERKEQTRLRREEGRLRASHAAAGKRILRLPAVEVMTGKRRTAIYDDINKGQFPAPVPLGGRAVGWIENEIIEWQQRCIAKRDEKRADR